MTHTISESCTGCTACVKVCPVNAITGERDHLHVIDAVVCVDCGACGRICPAAAVYDEQGVLCQMVKRSQWLKPVVEIRKCVSCGVCLQVCPTTVLAWRDQTDHVENLFPYLVDAKNCIGCSFCSSACPTGAIEMLVLAA